MRTMTCVVAFVTLLLVGFLATPGLFKIVDPEYVLALREHSGQLTKLGNESGDLDPGIADLQSKISSLERRFKELGNAVSAKQAEMRLTNAPATEIAAIAIEFGTKANGVASEIGQAQDEKKVLEDKKASIEASRAELQKKIDLAAADSVNIYLVTRALALGAIGALMSIFAKYLSIPNTHPLFDDAASMGRMWASIALGGIVSVVVIGLFFTGFISIFSNAAQNTGTTDFWKVTILCLLAGAFSDRLFQAAAGRMESYLRTGESGSKASVAAAAAARRPVQRKPKRSQTKVAGN